MKRVLVSVMSLVLVVLFVSCGSEGNNTSESNSSKLNSNSETTGFLKQPEAELDFNHMDIDWNNESLKFKDSGGYEFKAEFKLSPWILLSNTDAIKSAWSEVSQDNELPAFEDWGLGFSSNHYTYSATGFNAEMNDMYYCVGTVKISNTTSGWNISEKNPRNVKAGLGLKKTGYYDYDDSKKHIQTIGKTFGLEDSNYNREYIHITIDLKSDESPLYTFILMSPENFSPKNPKGDYIKMLKDQSVTLYGTGNENSYPLNGGYNNTAKTKSVNLGVIGKAK